MTFSDQMTDNAEKKYPYPVLAVTDLGNNYSPEHFRFAVGHCRDVIAKVIAEDNTSDQQIARVRILKYLDLQLARAVRWIEDEADLMASVMRSLIELKFWANFISESPEKATQFLHEDDAVQGGRRPIVGITSRNHPATATRA